MALKRLVIDGYGQVELNNVAFRRDGRIAAQCKPYIGTAQAPAEFANMPVENGMLLAIDEVNRVVKLPADNDGLLYGLVYSAEHIYDERTPMLKAFKLNGKDDFLPRLGYLAQGDKWTENCISYDDTEFANDAAVKAAVAACKTTALWGGICANGGIKLSATKPTVGPALRVIANTTMPNGTFGVKFQVYNA